MASVTILKMPNLGGSDLTVRERVPSMKNLNIKYITNLILYEAIIQKQPLDVLVKDRPVKHAFIHLLSLQEEGSRPS